MKKYVVSLLLILVIFSCPVEFKAAINWDGAQVVKGQTGKMTFIKDVKVYKKNANGTYSSMVVKQKNFFRVYNIEKYDNKTFYWMSSGYRVQATDLVVFKEVPFEIRSSFYENPGYIVINRQGTTAYFEEKYPILDLAYGEHLFNDFVQGSHFSSVSFVNGKLDYYYSYYEGNSVDGIIDGTDIRIVETTKRDEKFYTLTADAQLLVGPINGAIEKEWYELSVSGEIDNNKMLKTFFKGSAFKSLGFEINGYLFVHSMAGRGYIPAKLLQPVQNQGKRYIRYGVEAKGFNNSQDIELKRFDEVSLFTEDNTTALIEVNKKMYTVPKKVLATKLPNESPTISTSFLPNETLRKLEYKVGEEIRIYNKTINNRFESGNYYFIAYNETDQAFNYEIDGIKYTFEKPITEGSKVTRLVDTSKDEGFVRAMHYSFTTPAGTFNNVVETSFGSYFASGYGLITKYNQHLVSFED